MKRKTPLDAHMKRDGAYSSFQNVEVSRRRIPKRLWCQKTHAKIVHAQDATDGNMVCVVGTVPKMGPRPKPPTSSLMATRVAEENRDEWKLDSLVSKEKHSLECSVSL